MAGIATLLASSKQQAASSKQQAASSKQQASVAELRSFVNPFPHNFIGNREIVMFVGTGILCL